MFTRFFMLLLFCGSLLLIGCETGNDFPTVDDQAHQRAGLETLRSNLTIPAGETFVLGGGQPDAFSIKAKNVGSQTIRVKSSYGDTAPPRVVEPGETIEAEFAKGMSALLTNTSTTTDARMMVVIITPKQQLGMRYRPADDD